MVLRAPYRITCRSYLVWKSKRTYIPHQQQENYKNKYLSLLGVVEVGERETPLFRFFIIYSLVFANSSPPGAEQTELAHTFVSCFLNFT